MSQRPQKKAMPQLGNCGMAGRDSIGAVVSGKINRNRRGLGRYLIELSAEIFVISIVERLQRFQLHCCDYGILARRR